MTTLSRDWLLRLMLIVCLCPLGCAKLRNWSPYSKTQAAVLSPDVTKAEIIQHLNSNTERLVGWRSTDVRVSAKGVPASLSATIAVNSPRGFRLVAGSPFGDEADLGSNDERLWFWFRRSPHKHVFTCKHEELSAAQQQLPIPFRPDWMMDVLGVIPLDPSSISMQPDPSDAGLLQLISNVELSDGKPAVRIMTVDLKKGHIIAHQLYEPSSGALIAEAYLNDFRRDDKLGVILAHSIQLRWPEAELDMKLKIGDIEVNPPGVPDSTWQLPRMAEYPVFELAAGERTAIR
ncbi:hypothetical protein [Calycomorphotria hydatis]|nr:hypothetical protein [Calycomorphotria hydatis]